jgi:AraC family transcriptional regulator
MDPDDISKNMGTAFSAVADFAEKHQLSSVGNALSVYYTYDPAVMTFRAGFIVSPEDAEKAEGDILADTLPAGEVLNFIHRGPYAKLRDSYAEMMAFIEENALKISAPTVEIYLNNPSQVADESELETDVYVGVKAA